MSAPRAERRSAIGRTGASGLIFLAFVLVIGLCSAVAAAPYVSLRGQFAVDFPAEWAQVDYLTVDYFLNAIGADSATYNYDAVFATNKPGQFHDNEYVIITVEPVGELSRREQDSVVAELGSDTPVWDRASGLVTIASEDPTSPKSSVFALRFYNKGIAQFYFFTPDSTFSRYRPVIDQVLASFSTEDIDAKLPREAVRLADPNKVRDAAESGSSDSSGKRKVLPFGVGGGLVVIIILLMVARRKRRRS